MNRADKDYPALIASVKARHMMGHDALLILGKDQETCAESLRVDFPGNKRVEVVLQPSNGIPRVLVRREAVPAG